ncbi:hypothetical protein HMPREF1584_00431 [Gardnerella vaginalis JCP8481A]|nr:hypothetical protein HMPREF1584_00431 [Gardnerella vaginalis JCP8481A]EPI43814.1 hypothetical protein HMPREF1585_00338 [Gardnerella vaginalis JCP8481B]
MTTFACSQNAARVAIFRVQLNSSDNMLTKANLLFTIRRKTMIIIITKTKKR